MLMSIKNNELSVMLIKRKEIPFMGCWALPGGYAQADIDDNILACSKRELEEETGVNDIYLEELCSFTQKYRDPREMIANSTVRIITIAHLALIDYKKVNAIAGDDAEEVEWFSVNKLPKNLAFDHKLIIEKAIDRVRGKLNYSNVGFEFVDKKSFTIPELQTIFRITGMMNGRGPMTINEYYDYSESLTKTRWAPGFSLDQWLADFTTHSQQFYQEMKNFDLSREHSVVLSRAIVQFTQDQKLATMKYIWDQIKDDLVRQNQYCGIIYVIANSFQDEIIKDLLKIDKSKYTGRYSENYVNILRRYS